ncbi:Putative MFS transporter superfamily [Colletotrichum destructivum]|uniref:MFS transporter superfamily n=1 Tax=Colletotrichum destructivum TaxID=34406 RepID=A0AAX4IK35_9PEZI|nr:Putative MFS transporter superfamily [Colletotrichum destructivum]
MLRIFNAGFRAAGIVFVRESYAPVLLARKQDTAAMEASLKRPARDDCQLAPAAATPLATADYPNHRPGHGLELWHLLSSSFRFSTFYCIAISASSYLPWGFLGTGGRLRLARWVLVDVGMAVFVCGSFLLAQAMLSYLLDDPAHAASANMSIRMLSNVSGFVFPIYALQLFDWGNSVLAVIFIGLGCLVLLLLWRWEAKLRALGRE